MLRGLSNFGTNTDFCRLFSLCLTFPTCFSLLILSPFYLSHFFTFLSSLHVFHPSSPVSFSIFSSPVCFLLTLYLSLPLFYLSFTPFYLSRSPSTFSLSLPLFSLTVFLFLFLPLYPSLHKCLSLPIITTIFCLNMS